MTSGPPALVGAVGFEPTQQKHQVYNLAQLSCVGALPLLSKVLCLAAERIELSGAGL